MTLFCKKDAVAIYKEFKTGWSKPGQIWQNLLRKAMAQKVDVLPVIMIMVTSCTSFSMLLFSFAIRETVRPFE
jgi:hypothetical protein